MPLTAAGMLAPGAAQACMVEQAQTAYIHTLLPRKLPPGTIAAKVRSESTDEELLYRSGMRARVRKIVQGDFAGQFLLVKPMVRTSCTVPFKNGRSGFIVAVPRGRLGNMLVVDPIEVSTESGYALPNRYRLAPGRAEAVALPARD